MELADVFDQIERRIAERRLTVPVLPKVAAMVLAVINDAEADTGALAAAIRRDPALAGHVLKYANAPLLRTGTPVLTVGQAIARLGMRTVSDIVFAACIGPRLFCVPLYAPRIDRIWQESLATALWAHEMNGVRTERLDGSFLCGLLHQIGLPVVLQAVQDILGPAPRPSPSAEGIETLLRRFGVRAATDIATRWRLPEQVVAVVEYLDDPAAAPAYGSLVTAVSAARVLAVQTLDRVALDPVALAALPAIAAAGLGGAGISRLAERQPAVQDILSQG